MSLNHVIFAITIISFASSVLPQEESSVTPPESKIFGGKVVTEDGEFPYMVNLFRLKDNIICGGSLLSSTHVLTAAHCTDNIDSSLLLIRAGSLSRTGGGRVSRAFKIFNHEDYNLPLTKLENDIAVIQLRTPIPLSDTVKAVELPETEPEAGTISTISGWGKNTHEGGTAVKLHTVNIPIADWLDCKEKYRNQRTLIDGTGSLTTLNEKMICAGSFEDGTQGVCSGDSGGPLVLKGTNVQVGIVSWSVGCGAPGFPDVYTNVAKFVPWIKEKMEQSVIPVPSPGQGPSIVFPQNIAKKPGRNVCSQGWSVDKCLKTRPPYLCNFMKMACSSG